MDRATSRQRRLCRLGEARGIDTLVGMKILRHVTIGLALVALGLSGCAERPGKKKEDDKKADAKDAKAKKAADKKD